MEQTMSEFQQLWERMLNPERLQWLFSVFITVLFVFIATKIILKVGKNVIRKTLTPYKGTTQYRKKLSRAETLIPVRWDHLICIPNRQIVSFRKDN